MHEVRLILTPKSARLTIVRGDTVVEDETWTSESPMPNSEIRDIAECVFHDCYELLNTSIHGAPG